MVEAGISFIEARLPPLRPRRAACWSRWLLLILAGGVGLPLFAAAVTGNLAIPHNDAWSYSRITETFANTGMIRLLGWNRASLIGQVVMLGPLGFSLVAQQAAVAVLGAVVLLCCFRLVGTTLPTRAAVGATALIAIWPGWASLTTSFMSDVPALAGTFGALCLGRMALRRDSRAWLAVAILVSFWAATVREQSLAAPAAFLLYGGLTHRARARTGAAAIGCCVALLAVAMLAFELWHGTLPHGDHPEVSLALKAALHNAGGLAGQGYMTLAVGLSPAVLLTARMSRWGIWSWGTAGLVLLVSVVFALYSHAHGKSLVLGNYLSQSGEYRTVLIGTRTVIPDDLWRLVELLAILSGAVMAGSLVARWRNIDPILGAFTALTALMTLAVRATGQASFDRYLIALLPGLLTILLCPRHSTNRHSTNRLSTKLRESTKLSVPTRMMLDQLELPAVRRTAAAAAVVVVALVSGMLAANQFAFDIARWHAGQKLSHTGVAAERIDAGLEWLGWHSPAGAVDRHPGIGFGLEDLFSSRASCIVLSSSPQPGLAGVRTEFSYRTYLIAGHSTLYAYRTGAPGCRRR